MVFRKEAFQFYTRTLRRASFKYIVNERPKIYNDLVYPQLPFLIRSKSRRIKCKHENNPAGQLYNLTFTVSKLLRDERIVLSQTKATEIRPHVELLIIEAMRNGDKHRPTMALANFWCREKNLIHKLFKVFVPRYLNQASAFTSLHLLGTDYRKYGRPLSMWRTKPWEWHISDEAVLEMKGNSLPPIIRPKLDVSGLLNNILIDGARQSRRNEKSELENKIEPSD